MIAESNVLMVFSKLMDHVCVIHAIQDWIVIQSVLTMETAAQKLVHVNPDGGVRFFFHVCTQEKLTLIPHIQDCFLHFI